MKSQEQKENYQKKIESQLDEWRAEIDRLKAKARNTSADTKLKYQENIDKLEMKMDEGKSKLKDIRESSGEAWESIREGADSIWDTMKATFAEVRDKLSDDEKEEKKA